MKKAIFSRMATAAAAGTMAISALVPAGAAFAQVVPSSNNYYVLGGYNGGFGGGYGDGFGIGGSGYNGNLGQLFVLGNLFGGRYGNGVISPAGTSLGDLLILNQVFNRNYGW